MTRGGVGLSKRLDPVEAVEEAVALALSGAGRCDAALLFATPGHAAEMPRVLEAAAEGLSTKGVVGATAHGVIGAGEELEGGHGLVIAALSGVAAEPFLLEPLFTTYFFGPGLPLSGHPAAQAQGEAKRKVFSRRRAPCR